MKIKARQNKNISRNKTKRIKGGQINAEAYAWFVWEKGYKGKTIEECIECQKEAEKALKEKGE